MSWYPHPFTVDVNKYEWRYDIHGELSDVKDATGYDNVSSDEQNVAQLTNNGPKLYDDEK